MLFNFGLGTASLAQSPSAKDLPPPTAAKSPVPLAPARSAAQSYAEAQLAREKDRQHKYYESLGKNELETARYKAAQLRAQAAEKPMPRYAPNDNAYVPMAARKPGYYPRGGYPGTLPQREPVYISPDLEYAKMKEEMAKEKDESLKKVSAEKEAGLQQSLDNMQTQMKTSHVPGAAVAKPEGSNLFVRYYGPSPSSKPYEVHPAAARIVPHE